MFRQPCVETRGFTKILCSLRKGTRSNSQSALMTGLLQTKLTLSPQELRATSPFFNRKRSSETSAYSKHVCRNMAFSLSKTRGNVQKCPPPARFSYAVEEQDRFRARKGMRPAVGAGRKPVCLKQPGHKDRAVSFRCASRTARWKGSSWTPADETRDGGEYRGTYAYFLYRADMCPSCSDAVASRF